MPEYLVVEAMEAIAKELNASAVRFMVVGGLAMQAHGLDRITYDVDLVIQLQRANVVRAFEALERASYRPSIPIKPGEFADSEVRDRFRREKGMIVLNFWSDRFQPTKLDMFVAEPFDFDAEYEKAWRDSSVAGIELRFPRVETLLTMKRMAHRQKDLNDIVYLEDLLRKAP